MGNLAKIIGVIFIFLLVFVLVRDPLLFREDHQKVADAIHQHHELYGTYPKDLELLESRIEGVDVKGSYGYYHNDEIFVLLIPGGTRNEGAFYRSDRKEWTRFDYTASDPQYREFKELVAKIKTSGIKRSDVLRRDKRMK